MACCYIVFTTYQTISLSASVDVSVEGLGVGVDCHMIRPLHSILKRIWQTDNSQSRNVSFDKCSFYFIFPSFWMVNLLNSLSMVYNTWQWISWFRLGKIDCYLSNDPIANTGYMASNSHTIIKSKLDVMLRKLLCPKIRHFAGIFAQRHSVKSWKLQVFNIEAEIRTRSLRNTQVWSIAVQNNLIGQGTFALHHVAAAGYRARVSV